MKIDLIYTFENAPQQKDNLPFVMAIMKDKNTLIDFVTAPLTDDDKQNLIKISCCVQWFNQWEKEQLFSEWYDECKGKIWIPDLEEWRKERGIKSAVSGEYFKLFRDANS